MLQVSLKCLLATSTRQTSFYTLGSQKTLYIVKGKLQFIQHFNEQTLKNTELAAQAEQYNWFTMGLPAGSLQRLCGQDHYWAPGLEWKEWGGHDRPFGTQFNQSLRKAGSGSRGKT